MNSSCKYKTELPLILHTSAGKSFKSRRYWSYVATASNLKTDSSNK